jgi:hypothetical protein
MNIYYFFLAFTGVTCIGSKCLDPCRTVREQTQRHEAIIWPFFYLYNNNYIMKQIMKSNFLSLNTGIFSDRHMKKVLSMRSEAGTDTNECPTYTATCHVLTEPCLGNCPSLVWFGGCQNTHPRVFDLLGFPPFTKHDLHAHMYKRYTSTWAWNE